jgi:hypothetical protein
VRAEDQEAGPVGVPGQWPCGGQRGWWGAAAGAASAPAAPISCTSPQYRKTPISVYCDIDSTSETMSLKIGADLGILRYCLQYRVHIGADVGEKPDIGGGKKRVYTDMTPISV